MAEVEATVSIKDRLLKERNALLDLSTRNRLLNTPLRTRNNRAIEIVDEKSVEIFRLLTAGKALSFLPGAPLGAEERATLEEGDDVTGGIPQPDDKAVDERGVATRHTDTRLQTRLTSEALQKRLFDIWDDAQTFEQEQGVNVLYLALGLLRWFDTSTSDVARHAPVVLLPVRLERSGVTDRFKLKWREEPPSTNLTLQAKMKAEFGLVIADFGDEDEVDVSAYCARISETIATQKRWEVLADSMVLGFFSFAKFLMYRDLDPDVWPAQGSIGTHTLVTGLLRDGFPVSEPVIADNATLDDAIPVTAQHHVVDADSSQTVVIAEAVSGRNLVVKGPPGTGKSQTITNIIAAAVAHGKKVLFVAEKMAALEVVHRRLRQAGLGPLTLELHSNKANKRSVLEELKRTRDAIALPVRADLSVVQKLGDTRKTLNAFAERLHAPLEPSGMTPRQIIARLVRPDQPALSADWKLDGADTWNQEAFRERRQLALDLADRLKDIGAIPEHPWRGVRRGALDPVERRELLGRVDTLAQALTRCTELASMATTQLAAPEARTLGDFHTSVSVLSVSVLPPALDRAAHTSPLWNSVGVTGLRQLVTAGRQHQALRTSAERTFTAAGLGASYDRIRSVLQAKGASIFRVFSREYREQLALLRTFAREPLPKALSARIALIDEAIAAQEAKATFLRLATTGEAFGTAWAGEQSNWDTLDAMLTWRESHGTISDATWACLANAKDIRKLTKAHKELVDVLARMEALLNALITELDLDLRRAFAIKKVERLPVNVLAERLTAWQQNAEGLSRFIGFATQARTLSRKGARSLVDELHDGGLDHASLVPALDTSYSEVLRVALFAQWPELKSFDGENHDKLVARFRQLDKARIELAKEHIAAAHADARPHGAAGIGPLGVLNAEIARKRGHLPIRTLLERAAPAIQQLKPVFMMSPLSVAQFLKPGGMRFDMLVMDEASQIEPVDALGAIARVSQVVVVGDERQLPPTTFFKKLTGDDDAEPEDDEVIIQAKDAESILELCLAKGVPHRLLSWHYRSRHQSLIAVSNREFYENKLFIVPSPYDAVAGMGLRFNLLKDAPYDRGGTRINPVEAKTVAAAVMAHARNNPELSLGVATFSAPQREAILQELESLRRSTPAVEHFFSEESAEPFFVKNLENIQGDERDVIFISVGYGKTDKGTLAHMFGPLSAEGGERRLNVLISRAKLRCEVFCNFTGADIDLERTRAKGVVALKLFLTFAETGHFGLDAPIDSEGDGEFEMQVCERLQALGHDVKRDIGASGFRVDLAIADPAKPGRFVLGIECDGAQFQASRSARDRDRLRQQVLESHGWIIHRVWCADWYQRPEHELKKIERAIANAKSAWSDRDETDYKPPRAVPLTPEVADAGDTAIVRAVVGPKAAPVPEAPRDFYVEATFPVNRKVEPHEVPAAQMVAYVVKIVEIEGPVHIDEITARIRILWDLGRAGSRIRAAVADAAQVATAQKKIAGGPFYEIPGKQVIVRDRSQVESPSLRRPEVLPPVEMDEALLRTIEANFGAKRDELATAVSRLFGYSALSAQLREVLLERVEHMLATKSVAETDGMLSRPPKAR